MSWAKRGERDRDAIEKSRTQIASDRDAVQKKTFTKWVNSHLMKAGLKVLDLYEDLRDGKLLQTLLEMLTGVKLKMEKGKMRVHQLTNLNKLMDFLGQQKIDTLNITSMDILDGNPKLTLALVWRLILHYQLSSTTSGTSGLAELKQVILEWCQRVTEGYEGVKVTNFTTSWKSGLAFNAIINRFRPDLIDFDTLDQTNSAANLGNAFVVAERELDVPNLLDVEDFEMAVPDERSVLTYISFYVKAFPEDIPERRRGYDPVQDKLNEYEQCARPLMAWIAEQTDLVAGMDSEPLPENIEELKDLNLEGLIPQSEIGAKQQTKSKAEGLYQEFEAIVAAKSSSLAVEEGIQPEEIKKAWKALLDAMAARKAKLEDHAAHLRDKEAQNQAEDCWKNYEAVASPLMTWILEKQADVDSLDVPSSLEDLEALVKKMADGESEEWSEHASNKDKAQDLFASFQAANEKSPNPVPVGSGLHFDDDVQKAWDKLMDDRAKKVAAMSEELARLANDKSAQDKADDSWKNYEAVATPLMAWIAEKQAEIDANAATEDKADVEAAIEKLKSEEEEWKQKFSVKRNAEDLFRTFEDVNPKCPDPLPVVDGLHFDDDVLKAWNKLMADKDELLSSMAGNLKRLEKEQADNEEAASLWEKYEATAQPLTAWIVKKQELADALTLSDDIEEMQALLKVLEEDKKSAEWSEKSTTKDSAEELFLAFKKQAVYCSVPVPIKEGLHFFDEVQPSWDKLLESMGVQLATASSHLASLQSKKEANEKALDCWERYEEVASPLMTWINDKQAETDALVVPEDLEELKEFIARLNADKDSAEWAGKSDSKDQAEKLFAEFMDANAEAPEKVEVKEGLHFVDDVQKAWDRLMSDRHQKLLVAAEEQLKRQEEDLSKQQEAENKWQKYEAVASPLMDWIRAKDQELKAVDFPEDIPAMKELLGQLEAMKTSSDWSTEEANLASAHELFKAFETANAVSPVSVEVKDGLHATADVQPAWDDLGRALDDLCARGKERLANLETTAHEDHVAQQVELCHSALEEIKDKVDTFQADPGSADTRPNMKITAGELDSELMDWLKQHQAVSDLVAAEDPASGTPSPKVKDALELFSTLGDAASVLEKRIQASNEALGLLAEVDLLLQLNVDKDFEDNFESNKARVAAIQDDHGQFQAKHSALLDPALSNPHELVEQVKACLAHWDCLCVQLSSDVGKPVDDADQWLHDIETKLEESGALFHRSADVSDKQLKPLKAVVEEVSRREASVLAVAQRGEAISATEGSLTVKLLATGLPRRLQAVQEECKRRVGCVEGAVTNLAEYETELNSLKNWIAWAEGELSSLRELQNEEAAAQAQVDQCQKLLSDVQAHEPYVSNTALQGNSSVDKALEFDDLVAVFRASIEDESSRSPTPEKGANKGDDDEEETPIASAAVPVEIKDFQEHYQTLLQGFTHRLARLESRQQKVVRVGGLFAALKAFLQGANNAEIVDENSKLPAKVEVLDNHITDISSLGDRIEDSFVILSDATSSYDDLQADVQEDELVAGAGDETDSPGVLATLAAALKSLREKSSSGLAQLQSLKELTQECDEACSHLSIALGEVESDLQADEVASCEQEVLKVQMAQHLAVHEMITAQADLVEKAKSKCGALLARADVTEESREEIRQRLEKLEAQYERLSTLSLLRKKQLESTQSLLDVFVESQGPFSKWLGEAEVQCATMHAISVDSESLGTQASEAKELMASVEAQSPSLQTLLKVGTELVAVSSKTALDLFEEQDEGTSVDDTTSERAVDSWVKDECKSLPPRYAALQASGRGRATDVESMKAKVEVYAPAKADLDEWLEKKVEEVSQIESAQGSTVESLQSQLATVKEVLAAMDEQEPSKDQTMEGAADIVKDYNSYLEAAQQAFQAMPAERLDASTVSSSLEEESKPHVESLESGAEETKATWDKLRQQAVCLEGGLSTKLDLLKDAGSAMDSVLEAVTDVSDRVEKLALISARRDEFEAQRKETELAQEDLLRVQAQFAVLDSGAEASADIAAARDQADKQCAALNDRLQKRSGAFNVCDDTLTSDDGLNTWMDSLEEKLGSMAQIPEQATVTALEDEVARHEPDVKSLLETEQGACAEFESEMDVDGYNTRVLDTEKRFQQMQGQVAQVAQALQSMEDLFGKHRDRNSRLKDFSDWLEDLNGGDAGKIGLTKAAIAEVCAKRQDQQDQLAEKFGELSQFAESSAFDGLKHDDSLEGFDGENAVEVSHDLVAKFQEALDVAKAACVSAEEAATVSDLFEGPFAELYPALAAYEEQLKTVDPITGVIEHTEEQHDKYTALQQEISGHLPHVKEICDCGAKLKDLSEVDNREQEEFAQNVANMQSRWEMLLASADQVCSRHQVARKRTGEFLDDHLNPILAWINDVEPVLAEEYPVGGDAAALDEIEQKLQAISEEMKDKEEEFLATVTCGEKLIAEVLDDESFTAEQLEELTQRWQENKDRLQRQLERLASAKEKLAEFVLALPEAEEMIDEAMAKLLAMDPVAHTDLETAEAQEKEMSVFGTDDMDPCVASVTACLELCQQLIDCSPPHRKDDLTEAHDELAGKLAELQEAVDARNLEIKTALLELRGLSDTIELLETSLDDAENELSELERLTADEQETRKSEIEGLQNRLGSLRKELAEVAPELEALEKIKEQREKEDAAAAAGNAQMQTVGVMSGQFGKLIKRCEQLGADLEDAMTAAALMEDEQFDVEAWRQQFVGWLDENDLNVASIFSAFDADNSQELSRDELFEGLATCGFPMRPRVIDKVLDHFDEDRSGTVDKWEFLVGLRPERKVEFSREARNDTERVNHAVRKAVSKCTCTNQFRFEQMNDFTYRFGESQLKRMVRILRTHMMVRVGGGWEDLEAFLNKHDPCRAVGRTNVDLRKLRTPEGISELKTAKRASLAPSPAPQTKTKTATASQAGQSPRKHGMATRSQATTSKAAEKPPAGKTPRKPVPSSGYGMATKNRAAARTISPPAAAEHDCTDCGAHGLKPPTGHTMKKSSSASTLSAARKTSSSSSVKSSGYGRPTRLSAGDASASSPQAAAKQRSSGYGRPSRSSADSAPAAGTPAKTKLKPAPFRPPVDHTPVVPDELGNFAAPTLSSKGKSRSPSVSPDVSPKLQHRHVGEIDPQSRLMAPTMSSLSRMSPKIDRKGGVVASSEEEGNGELALSPTSGVVQLGRTSSGGGIPAPTAKHS